MENKILNVGVISCSGMATGHMKGVINNPRAKLVAVCDIDFEKAKKVAAERGVEKVYADRAKYTTAMEASPAGNAVDEVLKVIAKYTK